LFIQLATGFLLAAHYNPDATVAFENMEHIMRDVKYG
jgi:quinol-cytochrome oxidoreductase complex cytochrome b subunit